MIAMQPNNNKNNKSNNNNNAMHQTINGNTSHTTTSAAIADNNFSKNSAGLTKLGGNWPDGFSKQAWKFHISDVADVGTPICML